MSIKVTLEFASQAELLAFFTKDAAKPDVKAPEKAAPKPEAKPAAVVTAPAPTAAPTASSDAPSAAEVTPEQLTKVIVAAVARTNRDAVLGLLSDQFGVKAGKEITDPATRAKAVAAIGAL